MSRFIVETEGFVNLPAFAALLRHGRALRDMMHAWLRLFSRPFRTTASVYVLASGPCQVL